ncbi:hypothetical protein CEW46_23955 [Bacillus cereus]|nr:hypothetical protein CEW46_23955 [Bacillus cereus]
MNKPMRLIHIQPVTGVHPTVEGALSWKFLRVNELMTDQGIKDEEVAVVHDRSLAKSISDNYESRGFLVKTLERVEN